MSPYEMMVLFMQCEMCNLLLASQMRFTSLNFFFPYCMGGGGRWSREYPFKTKNPDPKECHAKTLISGNQSLLYILVHVRTLTSLEIWGCFLCCCDMDGGEVWWRMTCHYTFLTRPTFLSFLFPFPTSFFPLLMNVVLVSFSSHT